MSDWYALSNAHEIPTPTVLVYPDRIRRNIARMVELAGEPDRLRPHVKTHKLAQVVEMKLAAGIRKFKVATIAEAEMTAAAGGEDILLAHLGIWSRSEPYAPRLDPLIAGLKAKGLCFATIPEHRQWRGGGNG